MHVNLRKDRETKIFIEEPAPGLTPLASFLALRGVLKDDQEFDAAIDYLNQAWQEWTLPNSV